MQRTPHGLCGVRADFRFVQATLGWEHGAWAWRTHLRHRLPAQMLFDGTGISTMGSHGRQTAGLGSMTPLNVVGDTDQTQPHARVLQRSLGAGACKPHSGFAPVMSWAPSLMRWDKGTANVVSKIYCL